MFIINYNLQVKQNRGYDVILEKTHDTLSYGIFFMLLSVIRGKAKESYFRFVFVSTGHLWCDQLSGIISHVRMIK